MNGISFPQPASAARPAATERTAAMEKMQSTAREFEATFMSQVAKLMLESVEIDENFGGGHGEEMFRGVLAEKLGGEMATRGGIGLAPHIVEQMIKMQGGLR